MILDKQPERIAILRALQLGDMLCAVPVFRAIRKAYPQAHITLIGLPWARAFVRRFSAYLDDFIEFPGFPGLPERETAPHEALTFLREAQRRRFDLAIQLHGSGSHVNECVQLLGAQRSAGFYREGDVVPDAALFVPWRSTGTETQRLLRVLAPLGIASQGEALEFPALVDDLAQLRAVSEALALGAYGCVHPGARFASRRWPPARFAAVADSLADEGLAVVLTGVTDEAPVTRDVARRMRTPPVDLTGKLTLGALAALMRGARLVVCNDTGVSHIAAAVDTPSVVVACGSDVLRWAPADTRRHRVLWHHTPCRPCMHVECPIGHTCALGVPEADVTATALAVLQLDRAGASAIATGPTRPTIGLAGIRS